ncbi:alginate lyase family protein [Chitinophaga sp. S165]|uniref:alginate lyase family protein n=1 Tax=Chitinophaga sp. S165 TaxID=2135462 RepID=UPI000D8B190C|nr:alginate lyase family protein [Chitinophaga sp. S165]PWV56246.1 alginate lyase [Chitinophaga sp. S165]
MRTPSIEICIMLLLALLMCISTLAAQSPPETFLIKPAKLLDGKRKIAQRDTAMQRALTELLSIADRSLRNGPYSVVYKNKVPPSGNKHDYMSVGPYWWPDSSKANGLPYIRKDGQVNPERYAIKDDEFQNAISRDVYFLGLAWFYTGNEKYAAHAAGLLRTWFLDTATRMNPHLNYGQAIPGITDGRGIGLIDTHNVTMLIDGIQLLKGSKALSTAEYEGIQEWYRQFLQWMRSSPIGKDEADELNNHGTWYDVQQVIIALFTGQRELAKEMLEQQTKRRIDKQLEADGEQPKELARTLSWNYSLFNLRAFFELALLAENVQVDLWHYESPGRKSLKKAYTWLLPYATGKKEWQHQQIKPRHNEEFLELSEVAAKKYTDIDLAVLREKHGNFRNNLILLTDWAY